MKRTRTKFGPDATLSNLIEQWFDIKMYKGRNGYTEHWVCKRCPGDDPVHQSLCTSQGTRKRAHILGGKFAAYHRIKGCEGIDKEERKQLMALYTSCMRHSRKFDDIKGAEEDPLGGFNFSFKKASKENAVGGFYCGEIDNWDLGKKKDVEVIRPPKKRKIQKQKSDEDGRSESSDDDVVDDEGINKAAKEQRRENKKQKQLTNSFQDDYDDFMSFNRAGRNFLHGMYQVPVVEVRDPATDLQNFCIMLGFYVYLVATQPSEKKQDKPTEKEGKSAEHSKKAGEKNDKIAEQKDGS